MIYLDFSKAFDLVDHAILLQRLHARGVSGSLLLWFKSYLSSRLQQVVIENVTSEWSLVTSGAPQGSILGRLLFSVLINILLDTVSPNSNVTLYIDDSKVYRTVLSSTESAALLRDLNSPERWCIEIRMNFNPSKRKILSVSRKKSRLFHYILGGTELTRCNKETDLGIKMNNNLKFDSQVMQVQVQAIIFGTRTPLREE